MAKKRKKKQIRQPNDERTIDALLKVTWRLNFYEQSRDLCSIVSQRGAKLPALLATMLRRTPNGHIRKFELNISNAKMDNWQTLPHRWMHLRLDKDFLEIVAPYGAIAWLVREHELKIRCNYHLEAMEQMIKGTLSRYKRIAEISDGVWNTDRDKTFKKLLGR